jgi:glucokinase
MSSAPGERGPGHAYVIGVDFGGTKIEVALADVQGNVLARERLETRAELGPDQALRRTTEAVRRLEKAACDEHGAPVAAWAAVCPGVIQNDHLQLTPNLPGWERLSISRRLAEEFGVPQVRVANDVRAGALAEVRFGALQGTGSGIYVSLGTGIGAALTIGNTVLSGAHQASGEIAYMNPGTAPVGAVAAGRAPLEELVGGRALAQQASTMLGAELTSEQLFRRTDAPARRLVRLTLEVLAQALANLAVFVDPDRIVLGGGMMSDADTILPTLTELIASATPFPPDLHAARFRNDASLHGAIALAVDGLAAGDSRYG